MVFELTVATEPDAGRIAEVHMAAFGSNALLLAQFPTPAIRDRLRDCIAKKAADDIRDQHVAVLVARDQDRIVSFAKWSLPVFAPETHVEAPWLWPEESNFPVLEQWTEKLEQAQQRVLGDSPSYRLTFIGTDPQYERRGAATSLMRWGLDRCRKSNIPAYLESTLNAVPFYERLGFRETDRLSILLEGSEIYEEACCIFEPGMKTSITKVPSDTIVF